MYREGLKHVTHQARYLVMASLHLDVEIGVDTCTVAAVDEMDHAVIFIIDVQGLSITLPAPGKHQHQHVRYLLRPWRPRLAGLRARHTLSSAHLTTVNTPVSRPQKNSNSDLRPFVSIIIQTNVSLARLCRVAVFLIQTNVSLTFKPRTD